ncbi:histidinol-phosphate aminotransferase family protein [Ihubacter massiliensis]|uniref:Histidinol-phosphate aminotransferase family protein n=1 Tax=Hominibacterium faecale TaxID=2839743 RepID=A0A9J6QT46_9FIRM|nr:MULTISPECIES: histidinol-phosphate transaminase [Eubacteriales Family XIII. Incertae Sedis]MCC2864719.1 histidinol-phosphate aminotransferase family protein [Anaerovorax odorimutans]MCO7123767.1 histidinol-phosphate aminotransferase family protein [Ihubacter massiliensis]MCU7378692.1 histidinol-phosphate aminotransferase family protein [Hominibacterium faecale]
MYYVNENIKDLNRIFDQNSREGYLRLDLNENPGGLSNDFIRQVLGTVDSEFVAKYPETKEFTEKLADFIHVDPDQICLTNGSAEAIRHIIEVYTQPGGKIVSVAPSYAMYAVYSKMYGRIHVPVPYNKNMQVTAQDIIDKIDDSVDLVVVLNPNNPIGDVHSTEDMNRILAAAKEHEATVLIDEAYFYFYPNSFVEFAMNNDHVFLTRTFSKLFSLAGCRLGYVVGKADGIALIQKACTPHNVNGFGIKFAQAIIENNMIEQMVKEQLEGKRYLVECLEQKGYEVNAREGNFIFIKPKSNAKSLTKKLKENGILVKYYDNEMLGELIRVTTGTKEIMQQFVDMIVKLDC